jgi:hypothetical protein
MGYVITAVILVLVCFAAMGAKHVREETRMVRRQPRRLMTAAPMAGEKCLCGGMVSPTSGRSRVHRSCSDCNRMWTRGGRQVIRRRGVTRG